MDNLNGRRSLPVEVRRAVEALSGPTGAQPITAHRAETICNQLAERAYQSGWSDALMSLMTTNDVVERLAIDGHPRHANWVRRIGRENGFGWNAGRERIYQPDDYEQFLAMSKAITPGRPRKTAE